MRHNLLARFALQSLFLAVPAALASAQAELDLSAIWKDPTFQKQFVGTYGINPDIEPRVTPDEVKVLEKIRPLMGNDLPKAEEALRKLMKPDCSAVLDFTLGSIDFQQDKIDDALANYEKAVAKFPSFRRAWRNLGLIHVRKSEFDASIHAFVRMIELGGADGYAFGLLGYAYAAKQDFQAAEAAYRSALLMQPESTEWRLGLTRCVYKQEKFQDAAALLDVLIARYPDNDQFWLLQAHTFLGLKQPLKAAGNLEAVDQLGKSTPDTLQTLGDIYAGENLAGLAEGAYRRSLERDPTQPLARPLRAAELLAARGAVNQARGLLASIDKVHPQMQESERRKLLKLQARLALAQGEGGAEAVAVLEELVKLDPLDGEALLLLGQHYSREGEPDRAIFYYERAESLESFEVNARLRHAQVLVGMSRFADALPLLRRVQEQKPRDDVARYLEQVERMAKARRN
ncbi:MAG: tetratricopeptide repeat protein [Planctomycetes bacterium]|nr:tetratricopeptide repeat protein [Planctomycetota bacterium]